ncbi:MAG TPA: ribonuclease J [Microthrixaceae bacterium]|nr:ribonuclease J [Microthrixaceae bacterium]
MSEIRITFLGGLGEIGRNCAAFEQDGRIVLLDCGLMFPDFDMLGVDLVLPDFTWIRERADQIEGVVLTHGHEDHVGALPFLLREVEVPLYGSALTLGLARGRIEEAGLLKRTDLRVVADGERRTIGPFECEFLPVTHSVPHGFATAFHTTQGTILHTGDFKLDLTPVDGRLTDLARVGAMAAGEGIRLLLSDSTNADQHGHARSERSVGGVLYDLMHENEGRRVITACFASHIHRIQQIADAAISFRRKIAPLGRSMRRNITLARQMGALTIPDDALIDIDDVDSYEPGKVCVVSTGSQGEAMSALALLAGNENRWLKITPDDTVILSSHPIPGNEHAVTKVIDNLIRLGAEVVHSGLEDVHATGHAKQEDLKLFLSVARPTWFVPVHGEYRHLVAHARLAKLMGVHESQIVVAEDGDQLVLDDDGLRMAGRVPADYVYVHGTIGDVGTSTIGERRILGEEGVVAAIICVDLASRELVGGPEVATRGWVERNDSADLVEAVTERVRKDVSALLASGDKADVSQLERAVRRAAGSTVSDLTRRRPMIVPVVLEA